MRAEQAVKVQVRTQSLHASYLELGGSRQAPQAEVRDGREGVTSQQGGGCEPVHLIDEPGAQQGGGQAPTPFDQQLGQSLPGEQCQGPTEIQMAAAASDREHPGAAGLARTPPPEWRLPACEDPGLGDGGIAEEGRTLGDR